jgi:hypothetical protein
MIYNNIHLCCSAVLVMNHACPQHGGVTMLTFYIRRRRPIVLVVVLVWLTYNTYILAILFGLENRGLFFLSSKNFPWHHRSVPFAFVPHGAYESQWVVNNRQKVQNLGKESVLSILRAAYHQLRVPVSSRSWDLHTLILYSLDDLDFLLWIQPTASYGMRIWAAMPPPSYEFRHVHTIRLAHEE